MTHDKYIWDRQGHRIKAKWGKWTSYRFIDGTVRPIARPDTNQCNGQKRVHKSKYQLVSLPNSTIGHLYGPNGKGIFFFVFGLFNINANWIKF